MKKFLTFIGVITIFISCTSNKKQSEEQSQQVITVSILPQKTFIEKIAGDEYSVQVLVPEGASPESYSLLPSQLKEVSRSKIWFRLGYIGFELSWHEKIQQLNRNMKVVNLSEGLDLIKEGEMQHGDHSHAGGIDPHIWMSPTLVKQMSEIITNELSELNPEKSEEYRINYQKFLKEIDQLDVQIRNSFRDYRGKGFITFHPSLSYFARDYGLVQYTLESGGKEPTAQHMARVVELAKKENIDVIYIQSEFDRDHARVFAEEIDGKIVEVWPLNPDWGDNLLSITQLFIENF